MEHSVFTRCEAQQLGRFYTHVLQEKNSRESLYFLDVIEIVRCCRRPRAAAGGHARLNSGAAAARDENFVS